MNIRVNSLIQPYAEFLIKESKSTSNIGLLNGKMGYAISLFHIARIIHENSYKDQAYNLIETIYKNISNLKSYSYSNGLLGIGCGFQYIIDKNFIDGNSDEVLYEIDLLVRVIIDSKVIKNLDLEDGLCGIGYYLYLRLKNKINDDNQLITLKNKEYLIYLIDWIEELLIIEKKDQILNNTYYILCRLYTLNVFNYKINKMIGICLNKITKNSNHNIIDNYDHLGIPSLKLLKTWI